MAYVITDECVSCGSCADECPNEAISEGDGKYVIEPDTCVDNLSVAVVTAGEPVITDPQSALDLAMSVKYETGSTNIAINKEAITDYFLY